MNLAGGVVGAAVGLALMALLVVFLWRRRQPKVKEHQVAIHTRTLFPCSARTTLNPCASVAWVHEFDRIFL